MPGTTPRVRLGATWWLAALLAPQLVGTAVADRLPGVGGGAAYALTIGSVGALLLVVGAREAARCAALLASGTPVRRVLLLPVASMTDPESRPAPGPEAVAAVAALLVSTTLGGVFALALRLHGSRGPLGVVLLELTGAAVGLSAVHLLPGAPLDAGLVLAAALRARGAVASHADLLAARAGQVLVAGGALAALVAVVVHPSGTTLALLVDVGLVGTGVHAQASRRALAARMAGRARAVAAGELARAAVPVPAPSPLGLALARTEAEGAAGIVVVDGEGRPTGVVDERAAASVPVQRRPWTAVADVAHPVRDRVLPAALAGEALLLALRANPATEYLVVDDAGRALGVLAATDVARAVAG